MGILVKNCQILTMVTLPDGELEPVFWGDIAIEGKRILALGRVDVGLFSAPPQIIDGRHLLALPGLINSHSHAAMCLLRGYADDLPLMSWLHNHVWPIEARMREEDVAWGMRLAVLEMLKSGTTAFIDMYGFEEAMGPVVEETGIRACLAEGIIPEGPGQTSRLQTSVDAALKNKALPGGRISAMLGPHAPYTCPPAYLLEVMAAADQYGFGLHIHLAETLNELEQIQQKYQTSPTKLLENIGFFRGRRVLAAHGVYLDDEEIDLLKAHQVSIAHNPSSNMKLASGIAPVNSFLAAGLNVTLGTDSACSNNKLDMFQEMRLASFSAKVRDLNPEALPAAKVLELATVNGAKVLGSDDLGVLTPGNLADLILLNIDQPHFYPANNLLSHLVYVACGHDVDSVIIDGQLLVSKGQALFLDEEKIIAGAQAAMKHLRNNA